MSSTAIEVAEAIDVVRALTLPREGELSDAEAIAWLQQVEQLGRHVDALRVRAAGDIAERSRHELGSDSLARKHGAQSAATLIEKLARVSGAEASRRVRLAHDTAPRSSLTGEPGPARYSIVAAALNAGELGVDAALAIVRNLAPAERAASVADLDAAELELVDEARFRSADLIALQARVWRTALDPSGAEPRDRELRRRRRLVLGREVDGLVPFYGDADPVSAAHMRAWLSEGTDPHVGPRFLDPDDPEFDTAEPGVRDPRTREQRTFDYFMGLLLAGHRAQNDSPTAKRGVANVMVVVREPVLETGRGTASISGMIEPISAASAAVLACDSGIQKIYMGARGEPLALGRRERFHTAAQRKAMVVRDGDRCSWTLCTAAASWTHAHHVRPWSEGGATDVDNGVLLCPYHHHVVHEGEWQIEMRDGIPYLRAPSWLDPAGLWHRMGTARVELAA